MTKSVLFIIATLIAVIFARQLPPQPWRTRSGDDSLERSLTRQQILRLRNLRSNENAEELSGQIEGDMLIDYEEHAAFNGRIEDSRRWSNNRVPYTINATFFDQEHIRQIHLAAQYLTDHTCIRFVNRTMELDFVFITGDSIGCAAQVGRVGGAQRIRLQPHAVGTGCFRFFTIVHEFIHALGFHHMQNSFDRDNYVRINWDNVAPGSENNFQVRDENQISHFGVGYDVGSVMHYSSMAFSSNGQETMTAIQNPFNRTMGQRVEVTPEDLLRINKMYNCPPQQ